MKFSNILKTEQEPEWIKFYINYRQVKQMLEPFKAFLQKQPNELVREYSLIALSGDYVAPFENVPHFIYDDLTQLLSIAIKVITDQTQKANQFYEVKKEMQILKTLKIENNVKNAIILKEKMPDMNKKDQQQLQAKIDQLKISIKYVYYEDSRLEEFQLLNVEMMRRLKLKIQASAFFLETIQQGIKDIDDICSSLPIFSPKEQISISKRTLEISFAQLQNHKSVTRNIKSLKNSSMKNTIKLGHSYFLGFFSGICLLFLIAIIFYSFASQVLVSQKNFNNFFPIYRGYGLILFYQWCLSLNVLGWEYSQIDYKLILNFQNHYSKSIHIFKRSAFFTTFYLIIFLLVTIKENQKANPQIVQSDIENLILNKIAFFDAYNGSIILWTAFIIYYFIPFNCVLDFVHANFFNQKGKMWFLRLVFRCIFSPFYTMCFLNAFTADQLVSLVGPLKDVVYTGCIYSYYIPNQLISFTCSADTNFLSGFVIASIPLILRMMQCVKQCWEAGKFFGTDSSKNLMKYTISQITVIMSFLYKQSQFSQALLVLWIVSAAVSTIYSYYWDICKDWGFLQPNSKHRFLRNQIAYPPYAYYAIILCNTILRCAWILSISPDLLNNLNLTWQPAAVLIISLLEIVRRFLWNFIRMEKEHVANVGSFKIVPPCVYPFNDNPKSDASENLKEFKRSKCTPLKEFHAQKMVEKIDEKMNGLNDKERKLQDEFKNDDQLNNKYSERLKFISQRTKTLIGLTQQIHDKVHSELKLYYNSSGSVDTTKMPLKQIVI